MPVDPELPVRAPVEPCRSGSVLVESMSPLLRSPDESVPWVSSPPVSVPGRQSLRGEHVASLRQDLSPAHYCDGSISGTQVAWQVNDCT